MKSGVRSRRRTRQLRVVATADDDGSSPQPFSEDDVTEDTNEWYQGERNAGMLKLGNLS